MPSRLVKQRKRAARQARRNAEVADVPTTVPEPNASRVAQGGRVNREEEMKADPTEEAVRRMVEAAYT